MSQSIKIKILEDKLREARAVNDEELSESRRERIDAAYKAEFQRLIFQDLGRQAGDLYRRQLQFGKDCA
jgi:hypothetical protein